MSFNKITIVGNLGADPELRYTPDGTAVCSFTLATNEKRGEKEVTTWFKVTLWRKRAETANKYLMKGSPVFIEGRLAIEEWTDRDGKNRYTLDVQATDMQFIGNKGGGQSSDDMNHSGQEEVADEPQSKIRAAVATGSRPVDDDDIPF